MFLKSMWQVDEESVLQSETLNIFQITVMFAFCQYSLNTVTVQSCVLIKLSSVHADTCIPSQFHFFISRYLLWTPANSNFFRFSYEVQVTESRLYML